MARFREGTRKKTKIRGPNLKKVNAALKKAGGLPVGGGVFRVIDVQTFMGCTWDKMDEKTQAVLRDKWGTGMNIPGMSTAKTICEGGNFPVLHGVCKKLLRKGDCDSVRDLLKEDPREIESMFALEEVMLKTLRMERDDRQEDGMLRRIMEKLSLALDRPSRLELTTIMQRIKDAGVIKEVKDKLHARERIVSILQRRKKTMAELKARHASATSTDSTEKEEACKNLQKRTGCVLLGYFGALDPAWPGEDLTTGMLLDD